ncbi:hypothetical protein QTP88_012838 [Uroleucon formosanum]
MSSIVLLTSNIQNSCSQYCPLYESFKSKFCLHLKIYLLIDILFTVSDMQLYHQEYFLFLVIPIPNILIKVVGKKTKKTSTFITKL